MRSELIELMITALATVWLVYKMIATSNIKFLLIACVLVCLQLARWPVYLSVNWTWTLILITSGLFFSYEWITKRKIASPYSYILILISAVVIFSIEKFF